MAFNYSPKVITDGLVLYLDAANQYSYVSGSTSWNDISRGGNNGTLVNGPTYSSANGGSIVFDGVNDNVAVPNGIISGTGDFTIIQWVQSNGSPIVGTTFGNFPSGNLQFGWSQNYVFLWLDNNSAYASTSNFTTDITMISGRRIGTTTNYFKNGNLIATGASSASIGLSTAQFKLGLNTINGETFTGKIYTTLVYNKGLSNLEILQNYNAHKSRFGL